MARKRKGNRVHGWLVIDKPLGMTSTTVVARVKRALDAQKAGHGGTLDPLATGVLPIALGEATKTVAYVMDTTKAYDFVVRWGLATDTDDIEGAVTGESGARPDPAAIERALPAFLGDIEQRPPAFSAIKVAGERAYDMARRGEAVTLEPRTVHIDRFELTGLPDADHAAFRVVCGKGTYIRSLARDLALALGTYGTIARIRRTHAGPFSEEDAIPLEKFESLSDSAARHDALLPVATALDDIPALAVNLSEAARLKNGQAIAVIGRDVITGNPPTFVSAGQWIGPAYAEVISGNLRRPVAIGQIKAGAFQPSRIFNL